MNAENLELLAAAATCSAISVVRTLHTDYRIGIYSDRVQPNKTFANFDNSTPGVLGYDTAER